MSDIFEYAKNGFRQTIGRSYIEINEPTKEDFLGDLRENLRNSSLESLTMEPIIAEMIIRHLPLYGFLDKIKRF